MYEPGETLASIGIDLEIVAGLVRYLQEQGTIPANFSFAATSGRLDSIDVEYRGDGTPRAGVSVSGAITTGDDPEREFNAWVVLDPIVAFDADGNPEVGIELGTIEEIDPSSLQLVLTLGMSVINTELAAYRLPVVKPFLDAFEPVMFPDGGPARTAWAVDVRVDGPSTLDRVRVGFPRGRPDQPREEGRTPLRTVPSITISIADPFRDPVLPRRGSLVPVGSGIQVIVARRAMDALLAFEAASQVGTETEGATIEAVSLSMHDLGIDVSGRAVKDPATITWDGTLLLLWRRWQYRRSGAVLALPDGGRVDVFTSGIDVDVDLPWWVGLLRGLLFFAGPIGWIVDSLAIQPGLEEAEGAPGAVRLSLASSVGDAFADMLADLTGSPVDDIPFVSFGNDAWVLDGHWAVATTAFAGRNETTITGIDLDRFSIAGASGPSVKCVSLATGHEVSADEAGRLLKSGVVTIPGYHGVRAPYGYYLRSNPNDTTADNLVPVTP